MRVDVPLNKEAKLGTKLLTCGGARGVMVIVIGNGHGDTSSNLRRDCTSHSTNTRGKGMNPIILPSAIGKK